MKAGLINVRGDDAKLERLRETAADLAAALKKTPSKAASFALIAFDPEAPVEDPVVREAVDALESRWATYVNTFAGVPITVLRAALLEALVQAVGENEKKSALPSRCRLATCSRSPKLAMSARSGPMSSRT